MKSIVRHMIATLIVVPVFALSGTADGLIRVIQATPNPNVGVSLLFTGTLNFFLVSLLFLAVVTPVASVADYVFKHKWPFRIYVQLPLLIAMLVAYLLPWTLFFGRLFFLFLVSSTVAFTLPLLLYWAVFHGLDREWAA